MQVCTSLQTDNHASTPPLSFLQAGCPSCCQTNNVKALYVIHTLEYFFAIKDVCLLLLQILKQCLVERTRRSFPEDPFIRVRRQQELIRLN